VEFELKVFYGNFSLSASSGCQELKHQTTPGTGYNYEIDGLVIKNSLSTLRLLSVSFMAILTYSNVWQLTSQEYSTKQCEAKQ